MQSLRKLSIPYIIWMTVLIVFPTIIIIVLSLSTLNIFRLEPFDWTFQNFRIFTSDVFYIALRNSIKFALLATTISFFIGYPVAYLLANSTSKNKTLYVTLLIVPIWSNMLLRIIAWEKLFYPNSILNMFGISLDLIGKDSAILIGMVSMYLPFMIFPIYTVLEKMDKDLIEASRDLGANMVQSFFKVTLPLSLSGIVSGVIMTLLPAMTAFALPARLSGGRTLLLGNLIEDYFMKTSNFNLGSLISIVLMIVMLILYVVIIRFDKEGDTLI